MWCGEVEVASIYLFLLFSLTAFLNDFSASPLPVVPLADLWLLCSASVPLEYMVPSCSTFSNIPVWFDSRTTGMHGQKVSLPAVALCDQREYKYDGEARQPEHCRVLQWLKLRVICSRT